MSCDRGIALFLRVVKPKHRDLARIGKLVDSLTSGERWSRGIACPFLVDHKCGVYAARPGACQTHLSTSLAACKLEWKTRKSRHNHNSGIPLVWETKLYGAQISCGSDCAMAREGWQFAIGQLETMVHQATMPDAIEAWLNGEKIFAEDQHSRELHSRLDVTYQMAVERGYLANRQVVHTAHHP
jgi:hypothetical protein